MVLSNSLVLGLDVFLANSQKYTKSWGRCALLCNHSSINKDLRDCFNLMRDVLGDRLTCVFSPQHGFYGTEQDNMRETKHAFDLENKIQIYSLYSETRQPSALMLEKLDTLIIDLAVVGCRIYTYKATMKACLQACKEYGKRVVVLDRPNPLGGVRVAGLCPDADRLSFVAPDIMPMQHGLSAAEAALFFNQKIKADLEVIKMDNWQVDELLSPRPWAYTSPNLPTLESIFVYPGTVLLEGTNISEGRGTSLPFQLVGAPYLKSARSYRKLVQDHYGPLEGAFLREVEFVPTFGKWEGVLCHGVHIMLTNPARLKAFRLGVCLIAAAMEIGQDNFAWKSPPYEYEYETLPMEVIFGAKDFYDHIKAPHYDEAYFSRGINEYIDRSKEILLYPRKQILFS